MPAPSQKEILRRLKDAGFQPSSQAPNKLNANRSLSQAQYRSGVENPQPNQARLQVPPEAPLQSPQATANDIQARLPAIPNLATIWEKVKVARWIITGLCIAGLLYNLWSQSQAPSPLDAWGPSRAKVYEDLLGRIDATTLPDNVVDILYTANNTIDGAIVAEVRAATYTYFDLLRPGKDASPRRGQPTAVNNLWEVLNEMERRATATKDSYCEATTQVESAFSIIETQLRSDTSAKEVYIASRKSLRGKDAWYKEWSEDDDVNVQSYNTRIAVQETNSKAIKAWRLALNGAAVAWSEHSSDVQSRRDEVGAWKVRMKTGGAVTQDEYLAFHGSLCVSVAKVFGSLKVPLCR